MSGQVNVAAMWFKEFIDFLNDSAFVERDRRRRMTPKILDDLLAHAMPVNPNGTINLREVCAWLACKVKANATAGESVDKLPDTRLQGSKRLPGRVRITDVLSETAALCASVSRMLSGLAECEEHAFSHLHRLIQASACGTPLASRISGKARKSKVDKQ